MNTIKNWICNLKALRLFKAPRPFLEAYTEFVCNLPLMSEKDYFFLLEMMRQDKEKSEIWPSLTKVQRTIWCVIENADVLGKVDINAFYTIRLYNDLASKYGFTEEECPLQYFMEQQKIVMQQIKEEKEVEELKKKRKEVEKNITRLKEKLAVQKEEMKTGMEEHRKILRDLEKRRKNEAKKADVEHSMQRSTIVGFVGGETREETRNRIYLETVEKEWTNLKLNRKKKESKGILKDYGKKKKVKRKRQ